jgi:flagellar protein FliS
MRNQTASLEYRRAATQHASVVGLVVALLDTLTGDLRRAAEAIDKGDVQGRCDQLIHGFMVLQQLEAMLDMERGGPAAAQLKRFYTHVRGQMMDAQFKLSSAILHKQIQIVLEVREAWQQLDSSAMEGRPPAEPSHGMTQAATEHAGPAEARLSFSCSF